MPDRKHNEEELRVIEEKIFADFADGRTPAIEDYTGRFPSLEEEVTEIFWAAFTAAQAARPVQKHEVDAVMQLAEQSRSKAEDLTRRFRELQTTAKTVAGAVNVPVEVVTMLQKRCLTDLPDKLLIRLARVLRQSSQTVNSIVSAVQQRPKLASQYRSSGDPQPFQASVRRFDEVMADLHSKGKLDDTQVNDWLGGGS